MGGQTSRALPDEPLDPPPQQRSGAGTPGQERGPPPDFRSAIVRLEIHFAPVVADGHAGQVPVTEPTVQDQLGDLVAATDAAPDVDADRADPFGLLRSGALQFERVDR
jgi:hypothetical protein